MRAERLLMDPKELSSYFEVSLHYKSHNLSIRSDHPNKDKNEPQSSTPGPHVEPVIYAREGLTALDLQNKQLARLARFSQQTQTTLHHCSSEAAPGATGSGRGGPWPSDVQDPYR